MAGGMNFCYLSVCCSYYCKGVNDNRAEYSRLLELIAGLDPLGIDFILLLDINATGKGREKLPVESNSYNKDK